MAATSKRRRVCVLTSGNLRVIEPCTGILLKQLRAAGNAIDFHAMFWDDCDLALARTTLAELDSLHFWTTPRVEFEGDFTRYPKPPETVVHNFLSMAWCREQLRARLVEEGVFDRYDLFVFVRLDTCYGQVLDFDGMAGALDAHDLLLPLNGHWNNGWNDQFCAARAHAMHVWLGLYGRVREYLEQGVTLHPETLLRHHMERHGARRGLLNLVNYLWRSDVNFRVG